MLNTGGELLLEPSCCFLQNRTMAFIGNCDKSGGFQVSVLNWIVLISADFVICLESNLVHLSKFESSWLGHHTTAAVPLLKVNCLFGWFQKNKQ